MGLFLPRTAACFEIVDIRPQGTVVVARFKGVNDRNAAEALNGTGLFVDRSALPADLEDEEFYHADLVGLDVRDNTGAVIGQVTSVQNFGGGDILEAALVGHGDVLIPFTKAAVPEVSLSRPLDHDRPHRGVGLSTTRTLTMDRVRISARKGHLRPRAASPRAEGRPEATGDVPRERSDALS